MLARWACWGLLPLGLNRGPSDTLLSPSRAKCKVLTARVANTVQESTLADSEKSDVGEILEL